MSEEERELKRISDAIDKLLLDEVRNKQTEFKLLLLGPGESGKSTFLKQMKIIHGEGYPREERKNYLHAVYHNICAAIQTFVNVMQRLNIDFEDKKNIERGRRVAEQDITYRGEVDEQILEDCISLWADYGIKECYRRRREFYIQDSAT
ncbi:hypothetical protein L9F63_000714 [Diploptera punctata]|uniref:Uncharacterized protein n=1 Tax=Diploptera punctata TaxID=6984 RepID=A0AAD8ES43_DIPPU|nr:hypothetical protein L9F63_000714 [Diploptera punctata]